MPKQIAINPKQVGSTIKIGRLPIFSRSLMKLQDIDNVLQIVVDGGMYAIEIGKSPLEKELDANIERTIQKLKTDLPTKEEKIESKKREKTRE